MANVSDKLASMACPLGILYAILAIAAAQSPPPQGTPVLINKGVVVSLFPYPYPGHVELFEGVNPSQMSQTTSSTQHPFQQENILITQLVPDPGNDAMYYIDVYTNSIYRWDNVTSTLNDQSVSTITQTTKVFEGLSRAICKLDLDYLTQNIYWSDPLLHWIAIKPANSADPADTKLLITDDVDYVAALTLDVESKLLFWVSSAYDDAKMEGSNLLGEERQVILSTSFGFVDDMTLDMKEKQLYWVDSFRMTVETAAYDGSGRRIIRRLIGTEFTSIAVMESNICLINFDSYEMQCMFKTSGDRYAYHNFYPSNPYAVGLFNPGIQKTPLENKCATKNCAHICVNTASQPKCLCGDGYTLDSDGMSCSRTNPLYVNAVVMTNSTHICMIQVSSLSSTASYKPIRCEVTNATKDTTHIQSHVAKNLLYYTAKSTEPATLNKTQLVQFDLLSQRHRVVVEDIEEPDDMVFDWVGEKMFTCHSKLNQIKSWDVVTGRSSIIYSGNEVTQVSELAIDPHRANLFWIAGTMATGLGIYVGTFVGGAATILVESGSLTRPSGISYEDLDDSVCFIDNGRFASVTVNGTLTNHRISVGSATMSLIYKNYAIWNDGPSTLKMSLFSLDASVYSTDTTMGTINSIALFSGESQKAFLDPCKISNGGCDDLCFRQNATVYCRCDFGRTLQPDGKACGATPLANNFLLVTDLSHDRIMQVSSDGNTLVSLPINNLMTPAMVRYGHHDNMLYWCEVGSKDIKRGNLNGAGVERLVTIGGESYPDRFAIDFTTNHLYYTVAHTKDINSSYIAVMVPRADQAETKTLIRGLNYVGGIVVHPAKGYIYFNEHGIETYIARAYSDGTNIKQLVKFSGGGQPLGMAIDYANNMLYWADAYTDQDKIEYIDLEGTTSSRGVLIRDMTSDPVDVTISAGFLFFVAYNKHQIVKVDLTTGNPVSFMSDQAEFGAMDSVDIVPTTNTQPANNQCGSTNGLCSHYCFATPNGKRCGCPDGLYLDQTTRTACTTAPPTCPMQIPNGQLSPGCSGLVGASCDYSCNGTKFVKNPSVPRLTCTPSYFWNHPTDSLCIERVCPTSMRNGQLVNCNARANEACQWTCKAPLVKKPNTEAVICFSNGKWSTELDDLCVTQKKCKAVVPNGAFKDCTFEPQQSCKVTCSAGYSSSVDFVHCLPDAVWENELENICQLTKAVTPEKQTQSSDTAGLTAAVAVVVTLLIIIIILAVAFYFFRRRIFAADKQNVQGRYRASPNVYFNASDSRGAATSPPEGFSNPSLHAGNGEAMPNTNPLKMDQINLSEDTTKQNIQNEGHYDSIKDGRPAAGVGPHEAVNPLYTTLQPREEIPYQNAEDVPEKPGYHRFN